jgi:hypothetical protein
VRAVGISPYARWGHRVWDGFRSVPAPGATDAELVTFESPAAERWGEIGWRLCLGVASALAVTWGAGHGIQALLAAMLASGGLFWWSVAREAGRTARRLVVSDRFLEATHHGGRRVRLAWDSVGEVQHFVRSTRRGPARFLRLVSIDRQTQVIFSDRLPGFERLMALVEAGVRHVGAGDPSAWRRMLWERALLRGVHRR